MNSAAEILARALELPSTDRAEIVYQLLLSLEQEGPERDTDYEASWAVEIEERLRRLESGESRAIPAEEVIARLRQSLRQGSPS